MDKEELNNVVCECVSDYEILNSAYEYIEKLEQKNKELEEKIEIIQDKFKEWKKDIEKERKLYLCERDCAFRLKESKKYLSYTKQIEQLEDRWNKLKEYCQNNSFMQNTREYGTLTVVDADELAIYMEELERSDGNE